MPWPPLQRNRSRCPPRESSLHFINQDYYSAAFFLSKPTREDGRRVGRVRVGVREGACAVQYIQYQERAGAGGDSDGGTCACYVYPLLRSYLDACDAIRCDAMEMERPR
jgi:hypothetical protein